MDTAPENNTKIPLHIAQLRHDLRTPINAIVNYSEMLAEEAEGTPEADLIPLLKEIHSLGHQLNRLVGQVLNDRVLGPQWLDDAPGFADCIREKLMPTSQAVMNQLALALNRSSLPEEFLGDLQKIRKATSKLRTLIASPFSENTLPAVSVPSPTAEIAPPTPASSPRASEMIMREKELAARKAASSPQPIAGHILIVDDNEPNRDMLARLLRKQHHTFEMADNGHDALERLKAKAFDLVLLDVLMPHVDGFTVLRQMKADPDLIHIPVIMISAVDDIEGVVRCIEMGAEDYLPKPFDPVLLKARVDACLEQKHLRDKELDYLHNVAIVTKAAADIEAGLFESQNLEPVAGRDDALGQLARMFLSMAREVQIREQRLQLQIHELRVEIDQVRKQQEVDDITNTDFFGKIRDQGESARRRRNRR
ncbi:MAG: response regulator [Gemmataceae bacterium]